MLVLSRKVGERIYIGEDIVLTICGIQGDKVRIGVDSPREVPVHREEVHNRIKAGKNCGGKDGAQ